MATETRSANITDLIVNSTSNCYLIPPEQMEKIQETGVETDLEPGIHVIRIRKGSFDYIKMIPTIKRVNL